MNERNERDLVKREKDRSRYDADDGEWASPCSLGSPDVVLLRNEWGSCALGSGSRGHGFMESSVSGN